MSQQVIDDFRGGLDVRKHKLSAPAGTLTDAINCHITPGGELEKRKALVRGAGLTGTFGLVALANSLLVFDSADRSGAFPQALLGETVNFQRIQHPSQIDGSGTAYDATKHAMTAVVASTQFGGKAAVAATFADGNSYGYYDGGLMFDLTDGVVLAHLDTTAKIAAALAAAINRTADYTASVAGSTVTISGTNGSGYAVTANNKTAAGTLVLTKQNDPVAAVVGTLAVGQMGIVKGSYGAAAYNQGSISKVLVNGVDILNATVNWTTNDENTAALISAAINAYSATSGYTASNNGKLISISSVAASGDLNGSTIAAVTQSALCVDDCGFAFAGVSFVLSAITVGAGGPNILTLVHPYPSVGSASGSLTTNVATVTCAAAHGLYTGDTVTITGLTGTLAPLNGTWVVTVTTTTAFTFALVHANIGALAQTTGVILIDATLALFYARLVRDINSTAQNWCAATDGKKLYLTRGQLTVAGVTQPGANSITPDDTVVVTVTGTVAVTTDDSATLVVNLSKRSISGSSRVIGGSAIGPVACLVSGGLGPYRFNWEHVSGSAAITVVSADSATTLFHIPPIYTRNGVLDPPQNATFICLVTDANGLTAFSPFLGVTAF